MPHGSRSNTNKTVSPITIVNKQNVIKQNKNSSKRSLPVSPTTPTMPPNDLKKTKLFASPNHFSAIAETADNNDDLPEGPSQEQTDTSISTLMKVSLPPSFYQRRIKLL